MSPREPGLGLGRRVYRALIFAYPPAFRRRYAEEMVEAFLHRYATERRRSSRLVAVRVWSLVLGDLARTVPREWLGASASLRSRARRSPSLLGRAESLVTDLKVAGRGLRKRPGFAVVATLTLGLGIGANAAAFSVVRHVVFEPLAVPEADRVFYLVLQHTELRFQRAPDAATVEALEGGSKLWTGVASYGGGETVRTDGGLAHVVAATWVSTNLMDLLGIRPLLGRTFRSGDSDGTGDAVAIVSEGFWRRELGGTPDALGGTIVLDDTTRTIVGVRPDGTNLARAEGEIWLPAQDRAYAPMVVGRLAAGVTPERALAELDAAATSARESEPDDGGPFASSRWVPRLLSPADVLHPGLRTGLLVVFVAIGMVLLIACANVSNMLLARGMGREGELRVRSALGASRWRLVRLFVLESFWLTAAGALLGLAIARILFAGLLVLRPDEMRAFDGAGLDPATLLFVVGTSVFAVLVAGVLPSIHVTGAGAADGRAVQSGSRIVGPTRSGRALVGAQVALTIVLLTGAGLLLRTFEELRSTMSGVDLDRLASFAISLPEDRYPTDEARAAFFDRLERDLKADPGVAGVAIATAPPLQYSLRLSPPLLEGDDEPESGEPSSELSVTPDYFEVMGVPWVRGRTFGPSDGPRVVVVNEAFARRYGAPGDVVGRRFRFAEDEEWSTIIGVVRNVKSMGLRDDEERVQVYDPLDGPVDGTRYVAVRARSSASSLIETLRVRVRDIDALLPMRDLTTGRELGASFVMRERFLATALSVFAALAVLLSAVGIYGVVSLAVRRRLPELGIRLALGATRGRLVRGLAWREARPVVVGVAVGLLAALVSSRILRGVLFGVAPNDPVTLVSACAVLLLVATAACTVPALRAATLDPVSTIRDD